MTSLSQGVSLMNASILFVLCFTLITTSQPSSIKIINDLSYSWELKRSLKALQKNTKHFKEKLNRSENTKFQPSTQILLSFHSQIKKLRKQYNSALFPPKKDLFFLNKSAEHSKELYKNLKEINEKKADPGDRFFIYTLIAQTIRTMSQLPHRPKTWNTYQKDLTEIQKGAEKLKYCFQKESPIYPIISILATKKLIQEVTEQATKKELIKFDPKEALMRSKKSVTSWLETSKSFVLSQWRKHTP